MFLAEDKEKNRVAIEEAIQGGEYYCPLCGSALIVKAKSSKAVKEHFAHKSGAECDRWNYDKSEWHRKWQNCFPKECQEVIAKKDGIKHIADVLINKTVIEFQHSPIKAEEIAERNRFYTECGYRVVWVFDADGKIKNKNKTADLIDPLLCDETDLCWRRAKQEFSIKIPENVKIYLHYQTNVSDPQFSGRKIDVLLLIKNVDEKQIEFYKTFAFRKDLNKIEWFYIFPCNFLKEYGVALPGNVLSIRELFQKLENRPAAQRNQILVRRRFVSSRRHKRL